MPEHCGAGKLWRLCLGWLKLKPVAGLSSALVVPAANRVVSSCGSSASPPECSARSTREGGGVMTTPPLFASGSKIGDGGRYQIRRQIGSGGMAEVYKAIDTRLSGRAVAIKVLSPAAAEHRFAARMRELFVQEAQALSRIRDDSVVAVFDFGIAEGGVPYMVMEYLHGVDLGAFLRAAKRLPVEEAADLMLAICSGVHACHLAGIIHRDLKPGNIFLSQTPQGRQAKVLDFGVAKLPAVRGDDDNPRTELVVGTPSYMSPEQAKGRPANELSDQYGIGALLYRCVSGRVYDGTPATAAGLGVTDGEGLAEVLRRSLDPVPTRRYESVHQLGQALVPFASQTARARWRPYYRRLPQPFDPTTTGSISVGPKSAGPLSEIATIAVDRSAVPGDGLSIGPADPTVLDPPPDAQRAAISLSLTTVDVLPAPSGTQTAISSISGRVTPSGLSSVRTTKVPSDRLRPRIMVSFALAAVLVAGISAKAVLRLAQREPRKSIKLPALVVAPILPVVLPPPVVSQPPIPLHPPASIGDASLAQLPASREGHVVHSDVTGIPSTDSKTSLRHARRHGPRSSPPPIQYDDEGLPIIH
jgi:serine/threonine protein kinase